MLRPMTSATADTSAHGFPTGARAAAVCLRRRRGRLQVLLVTSRSGHVTLPKGRIEDGEHPRETALREAGEEAGVRGVASRHVGSWRHGRGSQPVEGFLVDVRGRSRPHPTERWRRVRWVDLDAAVEALGERCPSEADRTSLEEALSHAADRFG
jgi:8-oxo-dGTP pyrophosphatase MutT (NUDIX family)